MSPPIQEDYNDEDDTGDYSSYWQSIPDPPMLDSAAASSSSSSSMKPFEICQDDNVLQHSLLSSTRSASTTVDLSVGQSSGSTITAKKRLRDVTNQRQLQQQQQLANASRTTKKQRRSLLLPCDDNGQSVTTEEADELKLSSCSSSSSQQDATLTREATAAEDTKPSASSTASHNNSNNDQHTQQRLIQLVREYCALPNNNTHQRIHSQQAQEIERLSSYPMPMPGKKFQLPNNIHSSQPTADLSNNSDNHEEESPTNVSERKQKSNTTTTTTTTKSNVTFQQEFILHLKPIVQEMEDQKQTDMMESRTATQCEMYKSRGRCYYVNVGTGDEVDPREYERRYLSWIGRKRLERLDCDRRRRRRSDIGDEVAAEAAASGGEEVSSDCESSFDMDQSVNMDDSMMSSAASSSVDVSMSEVDTTNTAAASRNSCNAHPSAASDINGNTPDSNGGTSIRGLGLPSLPPSNDPRVLAARTKLWNAIDVALENYSKEILAIQQGR